MKFRDLKDNALFFFCNEDASITIIIYKKVALFDADTHGEVGTGFMQKDCSLVSVANDRINESEVIKVIL